VPGSLVQEDLPRVFYLLSTNLNTAKSVDVGVCMVAGCFRVLGRCWLGGRKGIRPLKKLGSGGVLAWLSVLSEVQYVPWTPLGELIALPQTRCQSFNTS